MPSACRWIYSTIGQVVKLRKHEIKMFQFVIYIIFLQISFVCVCCVDVLHATEYIADRLQMVYNVRFFSERADMVIYKFKF